MLILRDVLILGVPIMSGDSSLNRDNLTIRHRSYLDTSNLTNNSDFLESQNNANCHSSKNSCANILSDKFCGR